MEYLDNARAGGFQYPEDPSFLELAFPIAEVSLRDVHTLPRRKKMSAHKVCVRLLSLE
jgi:hypothetical protein